MLNTYSEYGKSKITRILSDKIKPNINTLQSAMVINSVGNLALGILYDPKIGIFNICLSIIPYVLLKKLTFSYGDFITIQINPSMGSASIHLDRNIGKMKSMGVKERFDFLYNEIIQCIEFLEHEKDNLGINTINMFSFLLTRGRIRNRILEALNDNGTQYVVGDEERLNLLTRTIIMARLNRNEKLQRQITIHLC